MNAQQIFDTAAKHLLTQNAMAFDEEQDRCCYRAPDGKMCAVGVLIPDHLYDPGFEGDNALGIAGQIGLADHGYLLDELQTIHDGGLTHLWRDQLRRLARRYNLNTEVLDENVSSGL